MSIRERITGVILILAMPLILFYLMVFLCFCEATSKNSSILDFDQNDLSD